MEQSMETQWMSCAIRRRVMMFCPAMPRGALSFVVSNIDQIAQWWDGLKIEDAVCSFKFRNIEIHELKKFTKNGWLWMVVWFLKNILVEMPICRSL